MIFKSSTYTKIIQNPVEDLRMNVETGAKFWKHRSEQTLLKDVRELGGHRYMYNTDITDGNTFPDEVEIDLDMLCTLVLNGVGGEVDDTDVIVVDESALWRRSMELMQELPKPTSFIHAIGHSTILSLGARARDDVLVLGGPGDELLTEEHSVAWGWPTCIRQPAQSASMVDCQHGGGGGMS
jgi:hypothetical protein